MIKHAINLILLAKIMANKKQGRATYKSNTTKVGYMHVNRCEWYETATDYWTLAFTVRNKLMKANKCLFILRSLRKEGYTQAEIDYLFQSLVTLNLSYGLSVYGAVNAQLSTVYSVFWTSVTSGDTYVRRLTSMICWINKIGKFSTRWNIKRNILWETLCLNWRSQNTI